MWCPIQPFGKDMNEGRDVASDDALIYRYTAPDQSRIDDSGDRDQLI